MALNDKSLGVKVLKLLMIALLAFFASSVAKYIMELLAGHSGGWTLFKTCLDSVGGLWLYMLLIITPPLILGLIFDEKDHKLFIVVRERNLLIVFTYLFISLHFMNSHFIEPIFGIPSTNIMSFLFRNAVFPRLFFSAAFNHLIEFLSLLK